MPYIRQEERDQFEEILWLMQQKGVVADGDLKYILFAYCKRYIPENYNDIKNFAAELRECATEIDRRLLAPYEDQKILDNGDIE